MVSFVAPDMIVTNELDNQNESSVSNSKMNISAAFEQSADHISRSTDKAKGIMQRST